MKIQTGVSHHSCRRSKSSHIPVSLRVERESFGRFRVHQIRLPQRAGKSQGCASSRPVGGKKKDACSCNNDLPSLNRRNWSWTYFLTRFTSRCTIARHRTDTAQQWTSGVDLEAVEECLHDTDIAPLTSAKPTSVTYSTWWVVAFMMMRCRVTANPR